MPEPQLKSIIKTAVSRVNAEMALTVPFMGERVALWTNKLSRSLEPADYFLHRLAFPMLPLPWWLEKTCRPEPDFPFQAALAYSTINGYYHIRLIDNIMDGDADIEVSLLPALNFFQFQFQAAYQAYFPAEHPFWNEFKAIWFRSGESAMQDASLTEIDEPTFRQVAAQKICAAKIPIAATCYRNKRPDSIKPWSEFVDLLGCWHQMTNDLFDWHEDLDRPQQTYFLSEAQKRKQPTESVAAWVVREGFAWGSKTIQQWMAELKDMACILESPDLLAYLEEREAIDLERQAKAIAGLQSLGKLLEAIV